MLAMEKKNTNLITARLRRRLEGRNRLMGLAAENVPVARLSASYSACGPTCWSGRKAKAERPRSAGLSARPWPST